jgi:hypothetical protein
MMKSRFSPEWVSMALAQVASGAPVAEVSTSWA